jgi:hypothetical protein
LPWLLPQGPNSSGSKDGSTLSPPDKGRKAAKHKQKQQQQQADDSSSSAVDVSSWKALSDLLARKNDRINHLQVGAGKVCGDDSLTMLC